MRPYRTIKSGKPFRVGPLLDRFLNWFPAAGIRNSKDGRTFGPTPAIRLSYGLTSAACLVGEFYLGRGAWDSGWPPSVNGCLAMAGAVAVLVVCVVTWPPTVFATPEGLRWRRLLVRRFIPWDEIEAAYWSGGEWGAGETGEAWGTGLYIFLKGGRRYVLNDWIMGRVQLLALIKPKLRERERSLDRITHEH